MRSRYVLVAIFILLFPVGGRLAFNKFDPTFFILLGTHFAVEEKLPYAINLIEPYGYDGQFYFKTALDLATDQYQDAIVYDSPSYRKQRILYPLLAWALAFGQPSAIPAALILVNAISLLLLWLLFFHLCRERGLQPAYSLLPILYSGFYMALGRDLTEPLESMLVLALLWVSCFTPHKTRLFALLAALACMAKETTIIFTLPVSIYLIWDRYRQKSLNGLTVVALFCPYALFGLWKMVLNQQFGEAAFVQGTGNFTYPLYGVYTGFARHFADENYFLQSAPDFPVYGLYVGFAHYFPNITLLALLKVAAVGVATLYLLWLVWLSVLVFPHLKDALTSNVRHRPPALAWIAWFICALFFSDKIYGDIWSFVRVFSTFTAISFMLLFLHKRRVHPYFGMATVLLYLVTSVQLWLGP